MAVCASCQQYGRRKERALCEARSEVDALGQRLPFSYDCWVVAIRLSEVSGAPVFTKLH